MVAWVTVRAAAGQRLGRRVVDPEIIGQGRHGHESTGSIPGDCDEKPEAGHAGNAGGEQRADLVCHERSEVAVDRVAFGQRGAASKKLHVLAGFGQRQVASAAGVFGLQSTGALLRRSMAVVSGDTGVMHMATAAREVFIDLRHECCHDTMPVSNFLYCRFKQHGPVCSFR